MSPARLKDIIKENISFLILFIAGLLLILLLDMMLDEQIRANKNSEQMRLEQFRSSLNEQMRANDINQRRLEHQISQDTKECDQN